MAGLDLKQPQPKGRVVKCRACGRVYDLGELTKTRKFRDRCPYCDTWQQHTDPREEARKRLAKNTNPICYETDAFNGNSTHEDPYGLTNGEIMYTSIKIERNLLDEIKHRAKANGRTISEEIQHVLYTHYAEIIAKERIAEKHI